MSKKVTYKDFLILQSIPQKGKISTTEIINILRKNGFEITPRTVQRDLNGLAEFFDIQSDNSLDVPGWFWNEKARAIELPPMNTYKALNVKIMQESVQNFLPASITQGLDSYATSANAVVKSTGNSVNNLRKKIGTISRNMSLIAPKIKPAILEVIYRALLENKQMRAMYKLGDEEKEEYIVHPQGLVVVDEVLYVIGSVWDDDDLVQFSVHHFQNAELLDEARHIFEDFDINMYIENGSFVFSKNDERDEIRLRINADAAEYLTQAKLSAQQEIESTSDDEYILQASVQINQQFIQWLLSMGDSVEVLSPKDLQQEIALTVRNIYKKYY